MNLIYDNRLAADDIIVTGEPGSPPLTPNRGAYRQSARTSSSPWGVSRLSGTALSKLSAREIADALRRAVDRSCGAVPRRRPPAQCGGSGLVAIDEVGSAYADWNAARRAQENRDGPGQRLVGALRMLARPSPWGFSYASRVHLYLAGSTAMAMSSRGGFRQAGPALRLAGGVWIEMYTGSAGRGAVAFTRREWRAVPAAIARIAGGRASLHFVLTRARKVERVSDRAGRSCTNPMSCQWALADATSLNRAILANGVGAYRVGDQALEWLAEYNARFS